MSTTETESPAVSPFGDFIQSAVAAANKLIAERNSVAATIAAAQGDSQSLLVSLRDSSDDPQVVKLRDRKEKLTDQLLEVEIKMDEILKPLAESIRTNAQSQQEGLTAQVDEQDAQIRSIRGTLKKLGGDEALTALIELTPRANRSAVDGKEPGTANRVRGFDVYVDDGVNGSVLATQKDATGKLSSNLAAGARMAGVDTVTIQEGFFGAQGTKVSKEYRDRVEFDIKDPNGNVKHIVAVRHTAGTTDDAVTVPSTEAPVSEGAQVQE